MAKQSANQLPDAALIGRHHALQAHHEIPAVLSVEHNQLVLPGGHAQSCHLGHTHRAQIQLNTGKRAWKDTHEKTIM